MKLKYEFSVMKMSDEEFDAVPIGDGSENFRGMIRMNETAAAVFDLLKEATDEDTVVKAICEKYAESDTEEIRKYVSQFTEKLKNQGLLE